MLKFTNDHLIRRRICMFITSPQNRQIKHWKKLLTKKGRKQSGTYLLEGVHLFEEAQKAGVELCAAIFEEGKSFAIRQNVPQYTLPSALFSQLTETEQSQGVIVEAALPTWDLASLLKQSNRFLLLDSIQDPGNVGTMLRTAAAAGVDLVLLGKGTVDIGNSKVVRASMGALFHLPVVEVDLLSSIATLKAAGVTIVGTTPHQGIYTYDYVFPEKVAIVLGNEGRGISDSVLAEIDQAVMVPMPGEAESYNVAVTAGMVLYECIRQRR
jgi:TrmH family RNA methyltransferase